MSTTTLNVLTKIASTTYNEYLEAAKKSGQKIIGYLCTYVPEEIITAANCIPYRMRAVESKGTELADTYYSASNCTFPRNIFDLILQGKYKFLDGIIFSNSCDHSRRMWDLWRYSTPMKLQSAAFITVPHMIGSLQLDRYENELKHYKMQLETDFKIKITDANLENAIKLHNKKRALLRQLYQLRTEKSVPIKGSELLRVMMAVSALPVKESISLLEALLKEITQRKTKAKEDLKIFLAGGCMEEPAFLEVIESFGAMIIGDNICHGAKYCDMDIEEGTKNPLKAIAQRYLEHLACPRMTNRFKERLDYVQKYLATNKVDAVILEKLKFCILFSGETYLYRKELDKLGYPLLVIEREYHDQSIGQVQTRVQAFFEQIRNKKLVAAQK